MTDSEVNANRKAWTAALRSGAFKQATRKLRRKSVDDTNDGFCCLGVACEISNLGEWEVAEPIFNDGEPAFYYRTANDRCHWTLPRELKEWLGIEGSRHTLNFIATLSRLNDTGHDFPAIADYIDEYFAEGSVYDT